MEHSHITNEEPSIKWSTIPCHPDMIYLACRDWNSSPLNSSWAADSAQDPDLWNYCPSIPENLTILCNSAVLPYNHYYHPSELSPPFPDYLGVAPQWVNLNISDAKTDYDAGSGYSAFTHLGHASHFLTDVGNPFHTNGENFQVYQYLLYQLLGTPFFHFDYEGYVYQNWNTGYNYKSVYSEVQEWTWSPYHSEAATKSLAKYACQRYDTLNMLILIDPDWRENDDVRQITEDCIRETAKYTNGMVGIELLLMKVPNQVGYPTDPDLDGLFEDVNGSGALGFQDVVAFFNYLEWIADNEPISLFDFSGNGQIGFGDVVELFHELP